MATSVARTVINGDPDVQIKVEFESVRSCGGKKTGEKPSKQGENQLQTQPIRDGEYVNRTPVTDAEGERLSTALTMLPNNNANNGHNEKHGK